MKIIRNVCIDIYKHTSIYCNGSVKTRRCVCVWVYMRFVLRTQAWQCINDKILEGMKHTYTLSLSLERNKNSYRTLYDCVVCVCVHRAEFLLSFLSFALRCCLYGNNKRWREEEVLYSVYYLVGWFFFRVIILSLYFIVTCLLFFSSSPDPVRRQATEKRKGPSNRRKEASYFFLQVRVFFFCSSSESNTQYTLLSLLLPVSPPCSLSLYLFLFVNLHLAIHAPTHNQKQH